jgi:GT2 family glycosyltransferase
MDPVAPPVVAVVVAHQPGGWFDEVLGSLAGQDYPELSVLVLDVASPEGEGPTVAERVAARLPDAFVRRLEENVGFAAAADEVRPMVEGAAYYLFCHDDVALAPDAVHRLVEEAFRSNAGVVSPKFVSWDDSARLLHVGMALDKGGSVVDRVQPYEIDHGQHDAVRDVFVAPGGCTLVRADLFAAIGGFDRSIVAMGEDLDLCWRAQVAGARVIVAPDAVVRHREELAAGRRPLEPALVGAPREGARATTLRELQRRHELAAVLTCYGTGHLVRVVPQVAVLALAEVVVATVAGDRGRAVAVMRAWRWNLGRLGALRAARRAVRATRQLSDREVRALQLSGSSRLSSYGQRLVQYGFRGAHADLEELEDPGAVPAGSTAPNGDAEEVVRRGALSAQARTAVWLATALVVVVGVRGLLTGAIPAVGQFVPFPSWSATFTQFASGWHPAGVGQATPATPAFALLGVLGTVLFGAMGLAQKVLVLGCLPVGAWGAVAAVRPFGSQRAATVAGVAYLAMPLPYDALAQGRLDVLVAYAGMPWVLGLLFGASARAPYDRRPTSLARTVVRLGLLESVLVSFVPAAVLLVVGAGVVLVVADLVVGELAAARRVSVAVGGATAVAALLCLPWLAGVASAGSAAWNVFGTTTTAVGAPSWGSIVRLALGPVGDSPLAWGFAVAALLPVLLGRSARAAWAGRCWALVVVAWVAAWASGRGWTGVVAVEPGVVLTAAAAGLAVAIGAGVVAFEEDLRVAAFGWRQLATGAAAAAFVLGALPTVASALPGRFDLPTTDFAQTLNWMPAQRRAGAFRILWLGDPRVLTQASWPSGDGLAYATSEGGPPDASWLWDAPNPGPAARLARDVTEASAGLTDQLGSLLAPAGVRYVAVLGALAPVIPGLQQPETFPLPPDLLPALSRQLDLTPVLSQGGITVYQNLAWLPVRAEVASRATPSATVTVPPVVDRVPGSPVVPGAEPVLSGHPGATSFRGTLARGTVLAALAPASRWHLVGAAGRAPQRVQFGWVGVYTLGRRGPATLAFDGGVLPALATAYVVLAWLAAVLVSVGGRPRWALALARRPTGRRRRSRAAGATSAQDGATAEAAADQDGPPDDGPPGQATPEQADRA